LTLLLELREAARVERDQLVKFNLKHVADELAGLIKAFAEDPTDVNLRNLNGKWSYAVRLLGYAGRTGDPNGKGSGLKEGALLAKVA